MGNPHLFRLILFRLFDLILFEVLALLFLTSLSSIKLSKLFKKFIIITFIIEPNQFRLLFIMSLLYCYLDKIKKEEPTSPHSLPFQPML